MSALNLNQFQILSIGIFGLFFGLFETSTNFFYLVTKNYKWSRLQHGKELPFDAEEKVVIRKVKQMLILGILLLFITLLSISISPQLFVVGSVLIFLNGLLDYSKYQNTMFFIIWTVIAISSIILIFIQ